MGVLSKIALSPKSPLRKRSTNTQPTMDSPTKKKQITNTILERIKTLQERAGVEGDGYVEQQRKRVAVHQTTPKAGKQMRLREEKFSPGPEKHSSTDGREHEMGSALTKIAKAVGELKKEAEVFRSATKLAVGGPAKPIHVGESGIGVPLTRARSRARTKRDELFLPVIDLAPPPPPAPAATNEDAHLPYERLSFPDSLTLHSTLFAKVPPNTHVDHYDRNACYFLNHLATLLTFDAGTFPVATSFRNIQAQEGVDSTFTVYVAFPRHASDEERAYIDHIVTVVSETEDYHRDMGVVMQMVTENCFDKVTANLMELAQAISVFEDTMAGQPFAVEFDGTTNARDYMFEYCPNLHGKNFATINEAVEYLFEVLALTGARCSNVLHYSTDHLELSNLLLSIFHIVNYEFVEMVFTDYKIVKAMRAFAEFAVAASALLDRRPGANCLEGMNLGGKLIKVVEVHPPIDLPRGGRRQCLPRATLARLHAQGTHYNSVTISRLLSQIRQTYRLPPSPSPTIQTLYPDVTLVLFLASLASSLNQKCTIVLGSNIPTPFLSAKVFSLLSDKSGAIFPVGSHIDVNFTSYTHDMKGADGWEMPGMNGIPEAIGDKIKGRLAEWVNRRIDDYLHALVYGWRGSGRNWIEYEDELGEDLVWKRNRKWNAGGLGDEYADEVAAQLRQQQRYEGPIPAFTVTNPEGADSHLTPVANSEDGLANYEDEHASDVPDENSSMDELMDQVQTIVGDNIKDPKKDWARGVNGYELDVVMEEDEEGCF